MSILEACASETCPDPQLLTASVSPQQQNPILKRLTRLMDSAGDETDADSESLELALLDVELTKYAAHEGIHIPAASPCTSAGGSTVQQQLSTTLVSPRRHAAVKHKPTQPGTVLQLVQQQSKFLDVLQSMIDKNVGLDKPQQHTKSSITHAVQTAAASTHPTAEGADVGAAPPAGPELAGQQMGALQVQYERQIADNHALKKRCLKVQKAMLRHMQAARAQAAAAEAAAEEARRRELQAAAANAALQTQLSQQQNMLEAQQQQLSGMQEQLSQLKDLHKKKLSRYKAQLQEQYESQLAAATTAYTQELSLVHAVQLSAGERFTSAGGASSCSDSGPTPRQLSKKPRQSSATALASNSSSQGVLAHTAGVAGPAGAPLTNSSSNGGKKAAGAQGPQRRSTSGGGRSSAGGSSKPAAAAEPAVGAAPVTSIGAPAAAAARKAAAGSEAGSQEALNDADAAASAVNACLSTANLCGGGSLRQLPSLPLHAAPSSSQLLQQTSFTSLMQDPHGSNSTQQTAHLLQTQAQSHKKQQQQRQRQQAGASGTHRPPDTPRRATVNGSGPRQHSAAGESRAARSKTMPAAVGEAAAAAQAGESGASVAAAASASADGTTPAAAAAMPATASPVAEGSSGPAGESPAAVDGSVAVAVAQQLQSHLLLLLAQQLAEHLPPELADIDPNAILSLQQAVAEHVEQQEQEQSRADGAATWVDGALQQEGSQQGQWQQQQQGGGEGQHVPEEVLQYAQQYQQGGEGSCRPPTATPSVLQHQRQQQVPEAAAQLAHHFVTGGEGTSRPLTAPSSDRSRASQQQQQELQQTHQARASSPSGRPGRQAGAAASTHL